MNAPRRIAYVVRGRVQGVAFRACTRDAAHRIGVTGFVRNRPDRAVDGEAQGTAPQVEAFVAFLHEGSPWARVDTVEVIDLPVRDGDAEFVVSR